MSLRTEVPSTCPAVARALREDKAELRRYVMTARSVLQAVASFCHRRLQEVGVKTCIEIGAGGAAPIHAHSSTPHTAFLSFTKAEVRSQNCMETL